MRLQIVVVIALNISCVEEQTSDLGSPGHGLACRYPHKLMKTMLDKDCSSKYTNALY